jgi:hypothetical protein
MLKAAKKVATLRLCVVLWMINANGESSLFKAARGTLRLAALSLHELRALGAYVFLPLCRVILAKGADAAVTLEIFPFTHGATEPKKLQSLLPHSNKPGEERILNL